MEGNEQTVQLKRCASANSTGCLRLCASSQGNAALIICLLVLGFIGLFAFGYRHYLQRQRIVQAAAQSSGNGLPVVSVEKVRRAPAMVELTLPGNIVPLKEAYIYARASGYVRARHIDIGDSVQQNQILAQIEVPELDQQVQQARAALAQSEKQLEQANADVADAHARQELARVTWDRYRVLVDHGAVSRQEGDQQQANFRSTSAVVTSVEARIGSAEQNVRINRASLNRLLSMQEFKNVRAPFAGIITARNFDIGALISGAGASMGRSSGETGGASTGAQGGELFRLAQTGVVRVLVNVPENDAPGIRKGGEAAIQAQAFPNRSFKGHITRITGAVDMNSRTMLAEIQIQNPDRALLPGMYVQACLSSERAAPPLLASGDTIMATAGGLRVAVINALRAEDLQPATSGSARSYPPQARRIHLQEVQVGRDYGQEIEIIGGLQGWEHIVSGPGDEIIEGAIVLPVASARSARASGTSSRGAGESSAAPPAGRGNGEGRR